MKRNKLKIFSIIFILSVAVLPYFVILIINYEYRPTDKEFMLQLLFVSIMVILITFLYVYLYAPRYKDKLNKYIDLYNNCKNNYPIAYIGYTHNYSNRILTVNKKSIKI